MLHYAPTIYCNFFGFFLTVSGWPAYPIIRAPLLFLISARKEEEKEEDSEEEEEEEQKEEEEEAEEAEQEGGGRKFCLVCLESGKKCRTQGRTQDQGGPGLHASGQSLEEDLVEEEDSLRVEEDGVDVLVGAGRALAARGHLSKLVIKQVRVSK